MLKAETETMTTAVYVNCMWCVCTINTSKRISMSILIFQCLCKCCQGNFWSRLWNFQKWNEVLKILLAKFIKRTYKYSYNFRYNSICRFIGKEKFVSRSLNSLLNSLFCLLLKKCVNGEQKRMKFLRDVSWDL